MILALVLLMATTTMEKAFSTITYIKNHLRDQIGDQWLNHNLIAYIEKDICDKIENDVINEHY